MFKKLTSFAVIGVIVYAVMFMVVLSEAGFINALPNLGNVIICIIFAVAFNSLNTTQEKVDNNEKKITELRQEVNALQTKNTEFKKELESAKLSIRLLKIKSENKEKDGE